MHARDRGAIALPARGKNGRGFLTRGLQPLYHLGAEIVDRNRRLRARLVVRASMLSMRYRSW